MTSLATRFGRYSASKYKCFRCLIKLENKWVLSRHLVLVSGSPYYSVARLLPRWVAHGYLQRGINKAAYGGDYAYKLTARGKSWYQSARQQLRNAELFNKELDTYWDLLLPSFEDLMTGPFADVIEFCDRSKEFYLV